jgi:hypothetical protein
MRYELININTQRNNNKITSHLEMFISKVAQNFAESHLAFVLALDIF